VHDAKRVFLPLQTPQSEYDWFLIYSKSALVEQTTPASIFALDFCQNIPHLENNTVKPEQGVQMFDASYFQNSLLMTFRQVTTDGFDLEMISLRAGHYYAMVADTDNVPYITATGIRNMNFAVGGSGCKIQGIAIVSCFTKVYHFSGCGMAAGGVRNYRLFVFVVGYEDNLATLGHSYIDFFVASSYFLYGPELRERTRERMVVGFMPSHSGYVWVGIANRESGAADWIGLSAPEYTGRNDSSILKVQLIGEPLLDKYLQGDPSCRMVKGEITGSVPFIAEMNNCSFELGKNYRIFVYIGDADLNNDGTLKTIDFTFVGEVTENSAIPFRMPVPSSDRWRVVATSAVSRSWHVKQLRFFSHMSCERQVAVYPAPYRDPWETTIELDAPMPNGSPFSSPGPLPTVNSVVTDGAGEGWQSGHPCAPGDCHIGIAFGQSGQGAMQTPVQVGCVEIIQGDNLGEFATNLTLQYWRTGDGWVSYRTRTGLRGGIAKIPNFIGTVATI